MREREKNKKKKGRELRHETRTLGIDVCGFDRRHIFHLIIECKNKRDLKNTDRNHHSMSQKAISEIALTDAFDSWAFLFYKFEIP